MAEGLEFLPVAVFAVAMTWEATLPRRVGLGPDGRRWFCNFGLLTTNSAAISVVSFVLADLPQCLPSFASLLVGPKLGIDAAVVEAATITASFLCLDLVAFLVHRSYHIVPFFWRFHEVHHSDHDLDSTTSVRHHFLEAMLNFLILGATSKLLGIPNAHFTAYGSIAMAAQVVQHANIRLPYLLGSPILRSIIVTPDLHEIHHVSDSERSNKNFGILFSFWDRLFGTWSCQGYNDGIDSFGSAGIELNRSTSLSRMLFLR